MAGLRSSIAALFLAALISSPLVAQTATATAIHTVSVTVPPRVKVQVSSVAVPQLSSESPVNVKPVRKVAVRVTATRPWILSIGTAGRNAPTVNWSRSQHAGYTALSVRQTKVAAAERGPTSTDATLYLRSAAENTDEDPVVLTVAAQ